MPEAGSPSPGRPSGATGGAARATPYHPRHLAKPPRPTTLRLVLEWVAILAIALTVALVVRTFVLTTYWIPSPSMEPTLVGNANRHDRVIVNRLSYDLHSVHRGDIVVFSVPASMPPIIENGHRITVLIKRVIGLPGDHLDIRDHHVFVDGRVLAEPYLPKGIATDPIPTAECPGAHSSFVVPKGSVLVLGDNRGDSDDGRCFGPIKENTIVGRAFVRIWPLSHITWL